MLAKLQGATTYSCVSFMEWLLWLEDISLMFLPQSIYLHSNTSLHLTKFWKNQDLDCELSSLFLSCTCTHTRSWYRWMCQCRKKRNMQTNRPLRVDSEPAKCQIGRCFISASDSLDFHLFTLSHKPSTCPNQLWFSQMLDTGGMLNDTWLNDGLVCTRWIICPWMFNNHSVHVSQREKQWFRTKPNYYKSD